MKRLLFILSLLFVLIPCKGQNNFFWSHNSSGLLLTFNNIANVPVADASSVSDWNTFFNSPTGTPFTSVIVTGNVVNLRGGSGITMINYLFQSNVNILDIIDSGCIAALNKNVFYGCTGLINSSFPSVTAVATICFKNCTSLVDADFPALITVGTNCFENCTSLITINLPICAALGITIGDDSVFLGITGKTITLTVPAALMTCNGGNPDGDIQYLVANNTVTIIQI